MKVGILTFSYTTNCGSALQAYALKKPWRVWRQSARLLITSGRIGCRILLLFLQ